jgi:hypothetical protein
MTTTTATTIDGFIFVTSRDPPIESRDLFSCQVCLIRKNKEHKYGFLISGSYLLIVTVLSVLEPDVVADRLVVVVPDTPHYRRLAIVHTCQQDSFLEIGCDFGPTVHRVQQALQQVGHVAKRCGRDEEEILTTPQKLPSNKVRCIGIDKSPLSAAIAKKRFPDCLFSVQDALTTQGITDLRHLCQEHLLHGHPTVVAIDINGNRELPAVLQCIRNVMTLPPNTTATTNENWKLPRLILVKSQMLYAELKRERNADTTAPCT